jgi:photosystem II stability/assembly factor-like uncharacterized protein
METSVILRYVRAWPAALMLMGALAAEQPATPAAFTVEPARTDPYAAEAMILAATFAGQNAAGRLVAVGEHGTVLLSDDGGMSFRQAKAVPNRATLTSVSFADEKNGWACGHWGTILATSDGGETWRLQRSDTSTDQPLFSVHFSDAEHGVAVGLWSLLLVTQDGGQHWAEAKLQAPPDGGRADRNLQAVFSKGSRLYVAAERGMVLRSDDQGAHWRYLDTGYKGSFWTGAALQDGTLLVGGQRGTLYRSDDDGTHWTVVDTHTKSSLTGIVEGGDGVTVVGLDGVVLKSSDNGRSFKTSQRDDRMALTSVIVAGGRPIGLSKRGILRDLLPASAVSAATTLPTRK